MTIESTSSNSTSPRMDIPFDRESIQLLEGYISKVSTDSSNDYWKRAVILLSANPQIVDYCERYKLRNCQCQLLQE